MQDEAKTPGSEGTGYSQAYLPGAPEARATKPELQQHSTVETISTIAAQLRGNPLGRASLVATPVHHKQQQPVGQQTSSWHALQPTNTHA